MKSCLDSSSVPSSPFCRSSVVKALRFAARAFAECRRSSEKRGGGEGEGEGKGKGKGKGKGEGKGKGKGKGEVIEALRGEFEASKALAFFLQATTEFEAGDEVDVDDCTKAFFECRTAAVLTHRAMGIQVGNPAIGEALEVESVGRVSYEWGSCLVKRGGEGDLLLAGVAFGEAGTIWGGGNGGGRFDKHIGMAERMKKMVEGKERMGGEGKGAGVV
ncbi:hypothetical protein TrRE_jg11648 [Triparma retinervis]|uniref:Uncharacterized protein n=1 Tax=Triparma retinervis TaxID=2557542 RepID=A0A9W7AEP7_9STRA|nr:hypothetical protein TrRE_jg11648 [Triparma retinervis]